MSYFIISEGAGDCSSCVAVILELARGISQWAHGFKKAVIFLLNTGEEEGLNGAHSFIAQVLHLILMSIHLMPFMITSCFILGRLWNLCC